MGDFIVFPILAAQDIKMHMMKKIALKSVHGDPITEVCKKYNPVTLSLILFKINNPAYSHVTYDIKQ